VSKLHYGQRDSDSVKEMQRRLIKLGFSIPAGATGNYFGQTDAAVRAWQRKIGDRPDAAGRSSIGPRQAARIFRGTGVTVRR
jgi:peptidoglycan hydrolase-like protein with peptidoglycan-binding domain